MTTGVFRCDACWFNMGCYELAFDWLLVIMAQRRLTSRELQPRADLVDGGGAAEAEEAEAENAGPHCPQGHAHQHRHRLEGGQGGQAGQASPAVRDRPV